VYNPLEPTDRAGSSNRTGVGDWSGNTAHSLNISFTFDPVTDAQQTEEVVRAVGRRPRRSEVLEGERDLEFWFDNEYSLEKAIRHLDDCSVEFTDVSSGHDDLPASLADLVPDDTLDAAEREKRRY
jgi:hypothetical protein